MNPEQQALMTEGYLLDVLGKTSSTFIELAVARIESADGTKYYDPDTDTMLFETMALADLFRYTEEEILDIPNYAAMLDARGVQGAANLVAASRALWYALRSMRLDTAQSGE